MSYSQAEQRLILDDLVSRIKWIGYRYNFQQMGETPNYIGTPEMHLNGDPGFSGARLIVYVTEDKECVTIYNELTDQWEDFRLSDPNCRANVLRRLDQLHC